MARIKVKCVCPVGHTISSSFESHDFSIEYEKVNKELIGSKIYDYCARCSGIQCIKILGIVNIDGEEIYL